MKRNSEKITIRLPQDNLEYVREQAEAENRTVSGYIRYLIMRDRAKTLSKEK